MNERQHYANYPINDAARPPGMHPDEGNLFPEEVEVLKWLKGTDYRFSDQEGVDWWEHGWVEWAIPVHYIYDDYRRWKVLHLYNPHDPEAPRLLRPMQFGAVLRVTLLDTSPSPDDLRRHVNLRRVCHRKGYRRSMRMLRGVRHPDAYYILDGPGRPRHERITPLQDETPAQAPGQGEV